MAEEGKKPEDDILGITSLLEGIEKAKAETPKTVMPKSKGFIRRKINKNGRPYYYLVRSVRVNGKVKQEVLQYLGTRCPRGYKPREKKA